MLQSKFIRLIMIFVVGSSTVGTIQQTLISFLYYKKISLV